MRNSYKVLDVINNFVFAAALITAFFIVLWLVEEIQMLLPDVFKGYQSLQDKRDAYIATLMQGCKTDEEVFTTKRLYGLGGSDMA